MKIENMNIAELIEYDKNPRINEEAVEKVAKSIQEFGFKNPIIVDKDNIIIAGHTRLKAALQLGMKEVPVIKAVDLNEKQVKAFRIADNKTSEFAEWDLEKLEGELKDLEDMFTGFNAEEFEEIMGLDELVEEDDYELDPPENPKSKEGDIYKLGQHTLMVGNSTSVEQVKKLMNNEQADLVVTDPPYNVNYEGQKGMKLDNDNMEREAFQQFLMDTFKAMNESMKPGAAYYVWHAKAEPFLRALRLNGMESRQTLVWVKSSMVMGRQDYQWKHEACLYGWKEGAAHYFIEDFTNTTVIEDAPNINQMNKDELKDYVKELQNKIDEGTTILREDKPHSSELHPTMKPIKLMARNIINSSNRGQAVLDLFGGSGSTLIACEQLGRRCFTMELDPRYADVIVKRWEDYTGETAELIER